MLKSQYVLLLVSLAAIGGLSLLPKSVVDTSNKAIGGATRDAAAQANAPAPSADSSVVQMHKASIAPWQQQLLDKWRAEFAKNGGAEAQRTALDSLGRWLRTANQYDSAAWYAEQHAKAHPGMLAYLLAGDAYYEAFGFAIDAQRGKDFAGKARGYYQQILDKDPSRLDVKTKLGMTYVAGESPMKAIATLREVLAEDPENQFAMFNMGLLSMQSGQFDKAKARFEQLLKLNPDDTRAMFYLGVSLVELGQKEEARKMLEAVKAKDSDPAVQASVNGYLQQLGK